MIRPIRLTDFEGILEIEALAFPKSQYDPMELYSLYLRYPTTFLVEVSDGINGYIVFSPDGHLISMAVRPLQRRRGIGSRLVEAAIAGCAEKTLRLEVRASNLVAQRFYRSLGFRSGKRVRRYYQDGEDALIMVRPGCNKGQK